MNDPILEILEEAFGIEPEEGERLRARWESLTPRERQTVELIGSGVTGPGAAKTLGISPKTLHVFRGLAAWKLGVPPVGFGKVLFYLRATEALQPDSPEPATGDAQRAG